MSSERGLRLLRIGADEREHRIDAVEQEMRADARLQRLQPGFGDRRRQRLRAKPEIDEQHAVRAEREQQMPQQRQAAARRTSRATSMCTPEPDGDGDRRDRERAGRVRLPREPGRERVEDRELER